MWALLVVLRRCLLGCRLRGGRGNPPPQSVFTHKKMPPLVRFLAALGISPTYRPSVQYGNGLEDMQQERRRVLEEPTMSTIGLVALAGRWVSGSRTTGRLQGQAFELAQLLVVGLVRRMQPPFELFLAPDTEAAWHPAGFLQADGARPVHVGEQGFIVLEPIVADWQAHEDASVRRWAAALVAIPAPCLLVDFLATACTLCAEVHRPLCAQVIVGMAARLDLVLGVGGWGVSAAMCFSAKSLPDGRSTSSSSRLALRATELGSDSCSDTS